MDRFTAMRGRRCVGRHAAEGEGTVISLHSLGTFKGEGELFRVLWLALWERRPSFSGLPLGMGTLVWLLQERRSREEWEKVKKALISRLSYFVFNSK